MLRVFGMDFGEMRVFGTEFGVLRVFGVEFWDAESFFFRQAQLFATSAFALTIGQTGNTEFIIV